MQNDVDNGSPYDCDDKNHTGRYEGPPTLEWVRICQSFLKIVHYVANNFSLLEHTIFVYNPIASNTLMQLNV
jgi:hypothetical protein